MLRSLILTPLTVLISEGGAGHHVEAIVIKNPYTLVTRGKLVYALSWFTAISNALSRISIVALYLRIFPTGLTRLCSWILLYYLVGFVVSQIITGLLECRPIEYLWNTRISEAKCIDLFAYYRSSGILNIVGDVAIMVVPMYTIWKLQASTARKAGIALAFLSGSLSVTVLLHCVNNCSSIQGPCRIVHTHTLFLQLDLPKWTQPVSHLSVNLWHSTDEFKGPMFRCAVGNW